MIACGAPLAVRNPENDAEEWRFCERRARFVHVAGGCATPYRCGAHAHHGRCNFCGNDLEMIDTAPVRSRARSTETGADDGPGAPECPHGAVMSPAVCRLNHVQETSAEGVAP